MVYLFDQIRNDHFVIPSWLPYFCIIFAADPVLVIFSTVNLTVILIKPSVLHTFRRPFHQSLYTHLSVFKSSSFCCLYSPHIIFAALLYMSNSVFFIGLFHILYYIVNITNQNESMELQAMINRSYYCTNKSLPWSCCD
jgi:hypothetical protein